jgi:serine/threonine protein kinase
MDKKEIRGPLSSFHARDVNEVFLIEDIIGRGTFGVVYKAKLKADPSQLFALKKVICENDNSVGFPFTTIREIIILKKYKHSNLSNLEEVFVSKPANSNKYRGSVYLAFKYIDHDLFGLLHCGKVSLSIPQIKNILFQILTGLEYLHNHSVIHRDLKSSNILVSDDGEVKIADFGLARHVSRNTKRPLTANLVTLWYRSPEILLGSDSYNMSSDMWSIGCIFVEILLGNPPFNAQNEMELFFQINDQIGAINERSFRGVGELAMFKKFKLSDEFNSEPKLKNSLERKFSKETADLAMSLLELDPKKRPTVKEVLEHNFFNSDPVKCPNEGLPRLDNHYHEYNIRNREYREENNNKSTSHLSSTATVEEMKVGTYYINLSNHQKYESFLKNKRKNTASF